MITLQEEHKYTQILVGVLLVLQITLLSSVYAISVINGYLTMPKIFISNAFRYDPPRAIAGFILPQTAVIIALVMGRHLCRMKTHIQSKRERNVWLVALVCVILLCYGFLGVAAVSLDTLKALHFAAAFTLFTSGTVLCICLVLLDRWTLLEYPSWLRIVRISLCITCVLIGVVLAATSRWQPLVGSIAEMSISLVFIGYFFTLAHSSCFPMVSTRDGPTTPEQQGLISPTPQS